MTRRAPALACALLTACVGVARASEAVGESPAVPVAGFHTKLDGALLARAEATPQFGARSRVIIRTVDGRPATRLIEAVNGIAGRYFAWLGGQVAVVPDAALDRLARRPEVAGISLDRAVRSTMARTTSSTGARWVNEHLGVTGSGVGVATIDSGVSPWHEDLDGRVVHFADFVNAQSSAYDDYGHGTHVAGIIAGSGRASAVSAQEAAARRGVAPDAHLVVLKALDVTGNGFTSNVIAAIDYAIANRAVYNIRVLNLSVAAGVYESFNKDPLTLAARRAVDSGIVVVAAAGNRGRDATGQPRYGGIASPRRRRRGLQFPRTGPHRRNRQARSRRARREHRIDRRSVERALRRESLIEALGCGPVRERALFEPDGHEHGGARGCGSHRAHARGQSGAHAECRQGHPRVHS
jgi:Subtilase family